MHYIHVIEIDIVGLKNKTENKQLGIAIHLTRLLVCYTCRKKIVTSRFLWVGYILYATYQIWVVDTLKFTPRELHF